MLFHPAVQNYGPTDERTDLPSLHGPLNIGVKRLPPLLYVAGDLYNLLSLDPSKRQ